MTQEQIKAKAKEYFPNDEFKQQIVIDAINWATEELQKENAELKEQIEKMKCCHNCKNCAYAGFEIICRTYDCINQSRWEMKEK